MYDHKLILEDQVLELGMTVPESTNADTAAGIRTGGQEGRLAVVIKVAADSDDLVLPITKTISITWLDSSDDGDDDAYAAPAATDGVPSYLITATAEKTWVAGDTVARLLIPMQLDKWAKINIAVDNALADLPTIDVFVEYLAN